MRRVREELTAHLGGKVSPVQSVLITRAAWLSLYIDRIDREAIKAGGAMKEHLSRQYLAWNNTLTRTLARLGLQGAPSQDPPGLARLLSGINTPAPASPPPSRATRAAAP